MTASGFLLFLARRLVAVALLLLLLSFGIFLLLYLAPGNIVDMLLGTRPRTPQVVAALRTEYHLNQPFLERYWDWLRDALHLNFGQSAVTGQSVGTAILDHAGVTVELGLYAFALVIFVGVPLGMVSAVRRRTGLDRGIVGLSVFGVSMPAFVSGIILLYLLAVRIPLFPAFGTGSGFTSRLAHLTLPAIALALTQTALVLKLTRASLIEVLEQDYVTFARARGLPMRRVLVTYALRNALIPVVTASSFILAYLVTGAVLIEVTFSLPGLGALLVDAVNEKDVTTVQGLALVVSAVVILVNLATDILYMVLDPRIRLGRTDS